MSLKNIVIGRFDQDPTAQGVIRPENERWQLVIDRDGYPHLYLQVSVEVEGEKTKGLVCLDDLLPEGMTIQSIMDSGSFGGELSPEEEKAAYEEYERNRAR